MPLVGKFPHAQLALCVVAVFFPSAARSAGPVQISTHRLKAQVESPGGALTLLENRLTGNTQNFRDIPFRLATTRGEIGPTNCPLAEQARTSNTVVFSCSAMGLKIEITYRVQNADSNALWKLISIRNETTEQVVLFDVVVFDLLIPGRYPPGGSSYYAGGINDVQFHKSGLFYDHSINLFLRDEKGGLFAGVENPFFEARYNSNRKVYPTHVEIYYRPNWVIEPGGTFEGDTGFIGVFKSEGVFRVPPQPQFFEGGERMKAEILDWGEVWAMQAYMAAIMAPKTLHFDDFIPTEYKLLDDIGRLGRISARQSRGEKLSVEERAMLKHFGGGPFTFGEQDIWYRLTPATSALYEKAVDDAASLGYFRTLVVPNLMAGWKGWFESPEEKLHRSDIMSRAGDWYTQPAYPDWQHVANYAQAKGMGMFNFEIAGGVIAPDHPEWRYVLADGTPATQYCYADRQFAAWHAAQVDKALALHPISHWQWDEGWMDSILYSVAGYIGDEAYCYASNHGHLPGNIRYQQFRNVMATLRTLTERHPNVRFVIISGLIPGMPWVMKYLNNDSHTGATEYGAWGDHNIYFLPTFKAHREGSVRWLAHGMSSGEESSGYRDWYTMLENPRLKETWKSNWDRWIDWTKNNLAYLATGRDLFAGPRVRDGLEGSAHCLGDGGWLFVHNPTAKTLAAEIPINRWLGLESGEHFQVEQVSPEAVHWGVWLKGHTLKVPVPPGATLLFHLQAVDALVREQAVSSVAGLPIQKAFLSLHEVFTLLNARDFWPASAMHKKGDNKIY